MPKELTFDEKELLKTFSYFRPGQEGQKRIAATRVRFKQLATHILSDIKGSRHRALAMTYLETARMYAILAVISSDPDAVVIEDEEVSGVSGS